MMIDLVLKPRIPPRVGSRLSLKNDRSAVRHDQARPDQKDARLAEGNLAVVDPYQARALRALPRKFPAHRHRKRTTTRRRREEDRWAHRAPVRTKAGRAGADSQ